MQIDPPDTEPTVGGALTPREIVAELDRHIVGQQAAKRAVAVALRNRWRRKRVSEDLRREIAPKNLILIGPTGVGKTEIARRIARLTAAPFVKVEATKFTEVGYVGKDVESMIRDLVEQAIAMVRRELEEGVAADAEQRAATRILDALYKLPEAGAKGGERERAERTREKLRGLLDLGHLDDRSIEIELSRPSRPAPQMTLVGGGMDALGGGLQDMLQGLMPKQKNKRRVTVGEARRLLAEEEAAGLVDQEQVLTEALRRVEQDGIVFIDEIDKIAVPEGQGARGGTDVSRHGVQRDILPIVEGTTVHTRHGQVKTDHILFVAAGAFHSAEVSDLMPELQGRFPIRVELSALGVEELRRILVEPRGALVRQYVALMETEGVRLTITDDAVARIAALAAEANERMENIGARRLHTVMEALLESLSFEAPERGGEEVVVDPEEVDRRLAPLVADPDLSRWIL